MAKIVVSDPLAEEGIALLQDAGHEVVDITQMEPGARQEQVKDAVAWIIRSGTQLDKETLEGAANLRTVGRAGVGVDNIDLDVATSRGVAVFNAPTGNITSAAEQAWALLLAAARHVPQADAAMKQEDWARKRLRGTELAGKRILIVGLGRIGRMMAKRAQAFDMVVLGHDPFVTPEAASSFGVEWMELDDGAGQCDIMSLHTPLTPKTQSMVGAHLLEQAKNGMILVNAARGPLVDSDALLAALESGKVSSAGIDVWPEEPPRDWRLAKHPRVVAAPHLGASTTEAQVKAAMQACERVRDFLATGDGALAVNAQAAVSDALRPWADLVEALSGFAVQILSGNLDRIEVAASESLELDPLGVHALVGALTAGQEVPANAINAPGLAKERGWSLSTRVLHDDGPPFLRVVVASSDQQVTIEGTCTPHYGARVTMLENFDVEFRPHGRFLFTRHRDVPGVLARITGVLAEAEVNVASVSLARRRDRKEALSVIQVDGPIERGARDQLRRLADILEAHRIRLPDSRGQAS